MTTPVSSKRAPRKQPSEFRVGRVKAFLRGQVWYLCYYEQGRRRRPRVGPDRDAAKQLAAQINGQLETGVRATLSFDSITIPVLRDQWIANHEHVKRSSLQTVNRYRTATEHLLRFLEQTPVRSVALFQIAHAEQFVRYLRNIRVAPNGHPNTAKRTLLDKGIQFILETCRSLFMFAAKRRYLPPYAENPFTALELGRMPLEIRRPIVMPVQAQVVEVFAGASAWEFDILLTLALTGMRPGELSHLLIEDFDVEGRMLHIRSRTELGWQTKTRRDRSVPLVPPLTEILQQMLAGRRSGTLFVRPRTLGSQLPSWGSSARQVQHELQRRQVEAEVTLARSLDRRERAQLIPRLWLELGMVKPDFIRNCLLRLSQKSGVRELATPKTFRHLFATTLQEGRVDPLIRNELLGHIPEDGSRSGAGLGMTAQYTHTRLDTKRSQLEEAFAKHPLLLLAQKRLTIDLPPS